MKKFFILIAITVICLLNIVSCTSENPLIGEWAVINYSDPFKIEVNELRNTYALHITVGPDVGDATVNKVKTAIKGCGIEKFSISNFDIEN